MVSEKINSPAGIANCGCHYHAEQGIPCQHDLQVQITSELGMPFDATQEEVEARVHDLAGDGLMGAAEQNEYYRRIIEAYSS